MPFSLQAFSIIRVWDNAMLSNQSTDLTELLCDFPTAIVAITLKNNLRFFFSSLYVDVTQICN